MFWRGWGECGRIGTDEINLRGGRSMRMEKEFEMDSKRGVVSGLKHAD